MHVQQQFVEQNNGMNRYTANGSDKEQKNNKYSLCEMSFEITTNIFNDASTINNWPQECMNAKK